MSLDEDRNARIHSLRAAFLNSGRDVGAIQKSSRKGIRRTWPNGVTTVECRIPGNVAPAKHFVTDRFWQREWQTSRTLFRISRFLLHDGDMTIQVEDVEQSTPRKNLIFNTIFLFCNLGSQLTGFS
jgi:hypothetical protein